MRRDICHYYERKLPEVFEAYRNAIMSKFGKNCQALPYHTISFGLNYSFRYNMNGGFCTIHFLPWQTGTAVDVRYTIMQAMGARYGKHDRDLTGDVMAFLGIPAQDINIPVDVFMDERNKVYAGYGQPNNPSAQPAPQPAPQQVQQAPQPAPQHIPQQPAPQSAGFCGGCGSPVSADAVFCGKCGRRLK